MITHRMRSRSWSTDHRGLLEAVQKGSMRGIVAQMRDSWWTINSTDRHGLTALHWAALQGRTNAVVYLLTARADPSLVSPLGWTALHCAALWGHTDIVEILTRCEGVRVHAANVAGETALAIAAMMGHAECVEALAPYADVSQRHKCKAIASKALRHTSMRVQKAQGSRERYHLVQQMARLRRVKVRPFDVPSFGSRMNGNQPTPAPYKHKQHALEKRTQDDPVPPKLARQVTGPLLTSLSS